MIISPIKMKFLTLMLIIAFGISYLGAIASAENTGFVQRDGDHLQLNGEPFRFSSSNQYYLFYKPNYMVDEVLNDAKNMGLKAFRIWGSCEGEDNRKDGYCFQPQPRVYDENTFKKMDYIIYKAGLCGIRLIVPLVNNWDDGFGGMAKYAGWSATAKANLAISVYYPGGSGSPNLAVVVKAGPGWGEWYESTLHTLSVGTNELLFDLSANNWKKDLDPQFVHPISNMDQVKEFGIVLYDYNGSSSIYVDNVRLGRQGSPILWAGAEDITKWSAQTDWSDATGISLSDLFKIEGSYSIKCDYNSSMGHGKAYWKLQTEMGNHDLFFTDGDCKDMYKGYINYFLNRANTITGIAYKNDPSILMWELANEPRCASDQSGNTLQNWIDEMAAYIKSIDTNHLVSTGGEGWYSGDYQGCDYIRNNQSPYIDVSSFHLFPNDNSLDEYKAKTWIERRINDSKNAIGKPVYAGEFGWKVDRDASRSKEILLHDFASNAENWYAQWGYNGPPTYSTTPSYNGNGAIKYTGSFSGYTSMGGAVWYNVPKDLSGYQYISGWIRIPNVPQWTWIKLRLYTKSGSGTNAHDTWSSMPIEGHLSPETWYQVKMPVSDIVSPADPSKIRSIGIQIESWNSTYTGSVYYDLVEAYTGSDISSFQQMAVRGRIYQDWCDLIYTGNGDGGGPWLLSGHQEDGTLYPDYDHYAVYYPEDGATCAVLQNYSANMNDNKWTLNLPVPWYQEETGYYSAAASAKMELDYLRGDSLLSQTTLYNYGHARNHPSNAGIQNIDPLGLFAILMNYKPLAYNFAIRALDNVNDLMRDICHWIDYAVPGTSVPNTPAIIPAYGGYDNWMVVKGAVASRDPLPNPDDPWYTPDFTVYGLWLNDPSVNGIGANSYKTAVECLNTYILPLVTTDPWNGKYVSIAEPPEVLSKAKVHIAGPDMNAAAGELAVMASMDGVRDLSRNVAWSGVIDPALMRNSDFLAAYKGSVPGRPVRVKRPDRADGGYYLIPFQRRAAKRKLLTSVVVIADASKGYFKEASWNTEPVEYLPMRREKALVLALRKLKNTIKHSNYMGKPISAELVWEPSLSPSPYYPVWRVQIGPRVVFVTQDGRTN